MQLNRWLPGVVVATVLLAWCRDTSMEWVWLYRWIILLALLTLTVAYLLWRRASPLVGVAFGYFCLHALCYSAWNFYAALPTNVQSALRLSSGMNLGVLLLVTLFLYMGADRRWLRMSWLIPMVVAAWGLALGVFFAPHPTMAVPILQNPSITGTFLAVMAVGMSCPISFLVLSLAILLMKASTPFLVLTVGLLFRVKRPFRAYLFLAPLLGYGFMLMAHKAMAGGSGRFAIWHLAFGWLHRQGWWVWLFGAGQGSTPVLVPLLQLQAGTRVGDTAFFMYLHNDWLQIFFEAGLVGLVVALTFWAGAMWHSRKDSHWLAMVAGYGAAMCTNFPLHSPLLALLGFILIGGAYFERD